jgi:hypothetical protein
MSASNGQIKAKPASGLRFVTLNAFVDFGLVGAKLTPAGALVWIVLYRFANPDGTVTVSADRIQACTGLSMKTVFRALKDLKAKGLVKVIARGGINRGASKYRIRPYSP